MVPLVQVFLWATRVSCFLSISFLGNSNSIYLKIMVISPPPPAQQNLILFQDVLSQCLLLSSFQLHKLETEEGTNTTATSLFLTRNFQFICSHFPQIYFSPSTLLLPRSKQQSPFFLPFIAFNRQIDLLNNNLINKRLHHKCWTTGFRSLRNKGLGYLTGWRSLTN